MPLNAGGPLAVAREHNGDAELRAPSATATEHGDAASAAAAPSVTATEKENDKENEKEKEGCTDAAPPANLGEKEHTLPTHSDKDEQCGDCGKQKPPPNSQAHAELRVLL